MGRLTRDPEVRYSNDGKAIAKFAVAVDRKFKREGEPEADFFNCTSFGKTAEVIEKYVKKGSKVAIVGRIENSNYTNRNGEKVYAVNILVDEFEFGESKKSDSKPAEDNDYISVPDGIEGDLPFV
jgi:single-strand DNA-binding protein